MNALLSATQINMGSMMILFVTVAIMITILMLYVGYRACGWLGVVLTLFLVANYAIEHKQQCPNCQKMNERFSKELQDQSCLSNVVVQSRGFNGGSPSASDSGPKESPTSVAARAFLTLSAISEMVCSDVADGLLE